MTTSPARRAGPLVLAVAVVVAVAVSGQTRQTPSPGVPANEANHFIETPEGWIHPVTPWGDPDIQGKYNFSYVGRVPLQRCGGSQTGRSPDAGQADTGSAPCDPSVAFRTEAEYRRLLDAERTHVDVHKTLIAAGDFGGAFQSGGIDPTVPQRQTSLIVDPPNGQLPPLTPEGGRLMLAMRSSWSWFPDEPQVWDHWTDFDTWDRCITRGLPASMFPYRYNNGMEILQAPGYVVLNLEMIHEARIVPVDGRPRISSAIRQWLGDSRGRWEGQTLVIETTNFKAGAPMTNVGVEGAPPGNRIPTSERLTITERITRLDVEHILYEITTDDPVVLTRPWTARFPLANEPTYRWWEYACHEGNRTIPDYISASRAERAARGSTRPSEPAGLARLDRGDGPAAGPTPPLSESAAAVSP